MSETDLDKIAKTKPVNLVKEEKPTDGTEGQDSSDHMEHIESFEDDKKFSTGNVEVEGSREAEPPQIHSLPESNSLGTQKALKLAFTLPASCYATMAIRELLKTSTSVCTLVKCFFCLSILNLIPYPSQIIAQYKTSPYSVLCCICRLHSTRLLTNKHVAAHILYDTRIRLLCLPAGKSTNICCVSHMLECIFVYMKVSL